MSLSFMSLSTVSPLKLSELSKHSPQSQCWQLFNRPFVQDLAFALACPNALTTWQDMSPLTSSPAIHIHDPQFWQQQFVRYQDRLHQLDGSRAYQQLTRYLMNRPSPYRLGFHFEGLMQFWLEDGYALGIHPFEVLAHNVQLYRDKQTVGELDFIIKNHATAQIEHWELSIKFYLGSPPYSFKDWVGINAKDTLHRKLAHMQLKQFKTVWVDIDFHDRVQIDKRYVILKGRFFTPLTPSLLGSDVHDNPMSEQADEVVPHQHPALCPSNLPSWLEPTFPYHHWLNLQHLSADEFVASLGNNHCDLFAQHDNNWKIRPAHYVEWFTQRACYNDDAVPVTDFFAQAEVQTGLHFINNTPVVITT